MGETDNAAILGMIVRSIERYLEDEPDATGRDVLRLLQKSHEAQLQATQPTDECRHCGRGLWSDHSGKWRHADPDNSVGCRAASFTSEAGWDESLDRRLSARPVRAGRRGI